MSFRWASSFVYIKLSVHYQDEERNLKVSYRVIPSQKTFNLRFYHCIISTPLITTAFLQLSHSLFPATSLSYLPWILVYVNWNELRVDHNSKPPKLIYTLSQTGFLNLSRIQWFKTNKYARALVYVKNKVSHQKNTQGKNAGMQLEKDLH